MFYYTLSAALKLLWSLAPTRDFYVMRFASLIVAGLNKVFRVSLRRKTISLNEFGEECTRLNKNRADRINLDKSRLSWDKIFGFRQVVFRVVASVDLITITFGFVAARARLALLHFVATWHFPSYFQWLRTVYTNIGAGYKWLVNDSTLIICYFNNIITLEGQQFRIVVIKYYEGLVR